MLNRVCSVQSATQADFDNADTWLALATQLAGENLKSACRQSFEFSRADVFSFVPLVHTTLHFPEHCLVYRLAIDVYTIPSVNEVWTCVAANVYGTRSL